MSNTYTFTSLSCDTFDVKTLMDMCGNKITNVAAPTAGSTDAARQQETTSATGNLSTKLACRYASVSNITDFTTKATVEAALDTVSASSPTLADGDRVLVRAQTSTTQNGIYYWNNGAGELQRAVDADGSAGNEVSGGDYTFVTQGDNHGQLGYIIIGSGVRTLGVDAIVWTAFTGQNNVSHTTLSNVGSNTHAQITSHIADSTLHFTEAAISHTNLLNKGTNTHAQIDSHIASTSNPHSVTIDQITPTTTKGDIIVRNASSDVRFGVGTDGDILVADSTQSEGVSWLTPGITSTSDYEKYTNYGILTGGLYYVVQELSQSGIDSNTYGNNSDISNDGLWLVVSDNQNNTTVTDGGRVYIYNRSLYTDTTWALNQQIESSDIQSSDAFGSSVAISSSPSTYIVVGAPQEDTTTSNAGSVYIFFYNGSSWSQQQKVQASDAATGSTAQFGYSVDIDDSGTYVVVGAPFNDTDGSNRGRAYIFSRSGSSWSQSFALSDPNGILNGLYGNSVAMAPSGTYVAVGRPYSGVGNGYIYIYSRSTGSLLQSIQPPDIASVDGFGTYIGLSTSTLYSSSNSSLNSGHVFYITDNGYGSSFIQNIDMEHHNHVASDGLSMVVYLEDAGTVAGYTTPHIWNTTSVTGGSTVHFLIRIYKRESVLEEFQEIYTYGRNTTVSPNASNVLIFTGASAGANASYDTNINVVYTGKYGAASFGVSFHDLQSRSLLTSNDINPNVAQSKDGLHLATIYGSKVPVLYSTGLTSVNIYKKNGDRWEHKSQITTQGGDITTITSTLSANGPFIAMSSPSGTDYKLAVYPTESWYTTVSDIKQKIFVWDYNTSANDVTAQAQLDLQDGSGGSYTPSVSAYIYFGIDCDYDVTGATPYYLFNVLDSPNVYTRYRSTAGSYGFIGPDSDTHTFTKMYGEYGCLTVGSSYRIFRSSASIQTISSSSSYQYDASAVLSSNRPYADFADSGNKLILYAKRPYYKVLPSTFSLQSTDRIDLFEFGGSTYDMVRPLFVAYQNDTLKYIFNVSEDGNTIIIDEDGLILTQDDISTEWNIIRSLKYPYKDQTIRGDPGSSLPIPFASSRGDINAVTFYTIGDEEIIATNADEPDPTLTTSSAAKVTGSVVGDFITNDSGKLIRVMPQATHALDEQWFTPVSVSRISAYPTEIFYAENTSTATASLAFSVYLTDTRSYTNGTYLVSFNAIFDCDTTGRYARVDFQINGVRIFDIGNEWREQPDQLNNTFGDSPFIVTTLSGTTTIRIRFTSEDVGSTASMYYGNIHCLRLA